MSFDEEPDDDPHGQCAAEIDELHGLLTWAYGKLHKFNFNEVDDALALDAIKLKLMTYVTREGAE